MSDIINKEMTFFKFVPEHLELMDHKEVLIKMTGGNWDIVTYYPELDKYNDGKKLVYSVVDYDTTWDISNIEYWTAIPNIP